MPHKLIRLTHGAAPFKRKERKGAAKFRKEKCSRISVNSGQSSDRESSTPNLPVNFLVDVHLYIMIVNILTSKYAGKTITERKSDIDNNTYETISQVLPIMAGTLSKTGTVVFLLSEMSASHNAIFSYPFTFEMRILKKQIQ